MKVVGIGRIGVFALALVGGNASGRYLSPEPLLQSPNYVRVMAQNGYSTPTYAYALNNPIRYTDPDGLQVAVPIPLPIPVPIPIPIPFGPPSPQSLVLPALIPSCAGCDPAEAPGRFPGGGGTRPLPSELPPPTWPESPSIPDFCAMGAAAAASSLGAICKLTGESFVKQGPVLQLWCNYDCGLLGSRSQRPPPTGGCKKTIGVNR
jgi:hypothetical protein